MDLLTSLVEIAVGVATLAVAWGSLRGGRARGRAIGAVLAAAGIAAVVHGAAAALG